MCPRTPPCRALRLGLLVAVAAAAVGFATAPAAAAHAAEGNATNGSVVTLTVERAPGTLPPEEAVAAATPNRTVRGDEWLVLTADVGRVLEVNRSTVLDARSGGTAGVALAARRVNPCAECPARPLPLANLTREVDAANGTITYLYSGTMPGLRGGPPGYELTLRVGPTNPHVDDPVAVERSVTVHRPGLDVGTGYRREATPLLPNRTNATLRLEGRFGPDKPLTVRVVDGNTLAAAPVTLENGTAAATVDLADAAAEDEPAREARLVVRDGHTGRPLYRERVLVGRLPAVEVLDITAGSALPRTGRTDVRVRLENEGTAPYDGPVSATLYRPSGAAGWTGSREVSLAPSARRTLTFAVRTANASPGRAELAVSAGGVTEARELPVDPPLVGTLELYTIRDDEWTLPGDWSTARVDVAVTNPGDRRREAVLKASIANRSVDRTVALPAGGDREVTVEVPTDGLAGSHTLRVRVGDDVRTRRIEIGRGSGTEPSTAGSPPGARTPGFGVGAALAAVALRLAVLLCRR